jgi:hypothetical protein
MARKRAASGRGRKSAAAKPRGKKAARGAARGRTAKARRPAAKAKTVKKAKKSAATRASTPKRPVAKRAAATKSTPPVRRAAGRKATAAAAEAAQPGRPKHPPSLERQRRQLHEVEDNVPTPPSSLDLDRTPSAARSGRKEMREARLQHNETSPELTGGDVDADWEDAYAVGDESPGGDNPTPDQDRVDDIGKALGVQYDDNEELRTGDKISSRDRHRWELDPASAEDYPEHEE